MEGVKAASLSLLRLLSSLAEEADRKYFVFNE